MPGFGFLDSAEESQPAGDVLVVRSRCHAAPLSAELGFGGDASSLVRGDLEPAGSADWTGRGGCRRHTVGVSRSSPAVFSSVRPSPGGRRTLPGIRLPLVGVGPAGVLTSSAHTNVASARGRGASSLGRPNAGTSKTARRGRYRRRSFCRAPARRRLGGRARSAGVAVTQGWPGGASAGQDGSPPVPAHGLASSGRAAGRRGAGILCRAGSVSTRRAKAEWRDLLGALRQAVDEALIAWQRAVFAATVLNEVPLDTLVLELASSRNGSIRRCWAPGLSCGQLSPLKGYIGDDWMRSS